MKALITIILIMFGQIALGQKALHVLYPPPILGMEYPDHSDFCDAIKHTNELVYTTFIYNGVDEYWRIHSPDKNCKNISAYLSIPDSLEIKSEDVKFFKDIHAKPFSGDLTIDAIGTFDDSSKSGYGYLGRKYAVFNVKYIIHIQK